MVGSPAEALVQEHEMLKITLYLKFKVCFEGKAVSFEVVLHCGHLYAIVIMFLLPPRALSSTPQIQDRNRTAWL